MLDDPVSSLDFQWRNGVARRLVEESKKRQVIVFTHDVVFLLSLRQYAEELGVEPLDQHVRHLSKGAGVCAEELPWVALPVKKKIGYLKNRWQAADKLSRDGYQEAYEKGAKYLYRLLREAWERALEEVFLGGVVERYRPGVQTQQIAQIADITAVDCKVVEIAMTNCSTWLPGHDKRRRRVRRCLGRKNSGPILRHWRTGSRKFGSGGRGLHEQFLHRIRSQERRSLEISRSPEPRRYELEPVKGQPERFKASSRTKLNV